MTRPVAQGALYLGLISGTSRDGLDVALVDLADEVPRLVATHCAPSVLKRK